MYNTLYMMYIALPKWPRNQFKPVQFSKAENRNFVVMPRQNQIYLVTFMCLTVDTNFIFTKKSSVAKWFVDIFNAEIAQCRQKLDIILGTKVVQL